MPANEAVNLRQESRNINGAPSRIRAWLLGGVREPAVWVETEAAEQREDLLAGQGRQAPGRVTNRRSSSGGTHSLATAMGGACLPTRMAHKGAE